MIQSQTATLLLASLLPSLKLEATGTHFTGTTSHLLLLNDQMGIFKILDQLIFKSLSKCLFQATCKIQKQLVQHSWWPSQVLRLPFSLNSYRSSSSAKAPPESTYYYTASPICSKSCLQNSFLLLISSAASIKFAIFTMNPALSLHVQLLLLVFGLAYQGKDIVFRFITEYSSLRDFGPLGNRSLFI